MSVFVVSSPQQSDCLEITVHTVILAGGALIVNPTGKSLSSAMIARSKMAHHKLV